MLAHTRRVIFLEEGDVADITADGVVITGVDGVAARAAGPRDRLVDRGGREGRLRALHAQGDARAARGDARRRSPAASTATRSSSTSWSPVADATARVERVELVACGTANYASAVGAYALPGLAAHPGALEHRLGVPLLAAAARRADARHRGHPVGRDGRHHRAGALRAPAGLPDHRGHQHRRLGDHPRGGRGAVPPGRPGDRGRGDQDVRDAGHDARAARGGHGQGARPAARRARARARPRAARAARQGGSGRSSWPSRPRSSRAATSTRAASCSSAGASPTRSRSRARSSSRRSATSTPRAMPRAS